MYITFHLADEKEKITNLNVADAIIEVCKDTTFYDLDPTVIAKAILLETERKENDNT